MCIFYSFTRFSQIFARSIRNPDLLKFQFYKLLQFYIFTVCDNSVMISIENFMFLNLKKLYDVKYKWERPTVMQMSQDRTVSKHMGWVRNVVLMKVYSGFGKPRGSGFG